MLTPLVLLASCAFEPVSVGAIRCVQCGDAPMVGDGIGVQGDARQSGDPANGDDSGAPGDDGLAGDVPPAGDAGPGGDTSTLDYTLVVVRSPGTNGVDEPLEPATVVEVRGATGSLVTDAVLAITLSLNGGGDGTAQLGGTVTVDVEGGRAVFPNLRIAVAGQGYTLEATAASSTPGSSDAFDIDGSQFIHAIAPAPLQTGVCSGPILLSVVSFTGRAQKSKSSFQMSLSPDGLALYGNASCTATTANTVYVPTGIDSVAVWGIADVDQIATLGVTPARYGTPLAIAVVSTLPFDGGQHHSCTATKDGSVGCWGGNIDGALGDGTILDRTTPGGVITGWPAARLLSLGARHTCAVTRAGAVYCTGENGNGQLGDTTTTDREIPGPTARAADIVSLSTFANHACAVDGFGGVLCWGQGDSGQVGPAGLGSAISNPRTITSLPLAAAAAVGRRHSCVLMRDGQVRCWGDNLYGQLGDGTVVGRAEHAVVPGLRGVVQLAAGGDHTCALKADRSVECWGRADFGQLGIDALIAESPTPLSAEDGSVQITAGEKFTCFTHLDRTVDCVGDNTEGQLGRDFRGNDSSTPAAVVGSTGALWVGAGWAHACASSGAELYCWGKNFRGELGNGEVNHVREPTAVESFSGESVASVSVGAGSTDEMHTCAILATGDAYCWGSNPHGQLGDGTTDDVPKPTSVLDRSNGAEGMVAIAAINESGCGIDGQGLAWCWGDDDDDILGQAIGVGHQHTPVEVSGLAGFDHITRGSDHVCAWGDSGVAFCWGLNSYGQLGNRDTAATGTPVVPTFAGTIKAMAAGEEHTCAIVEVTAAAAWEVACVGRNDRGQLGDGSGIDSLIPVGVSLPDNRVPTAIAAGRHTTCVVTESRHAACWGDNHDGQLGDGSQADRLSPVLVRDGGTGSLTGVVAIAGGRDHTCAIQDQGAKGSVLLCWGDNELGQLGLGDVTKRSSPQELTLSWTPSSVSTGFYGTCATALEGGLYCWGDNRFGQVGVGRYGNEAAPVLIAAPTP